MGWSRYQDANPVPTSPLADDIPTAPSGPVTVIRELVHFDSVRRLTGFELGQVVRRVVAADKRGHGQRRGLVVPPVGPP